MYEWHKNIQVIVDEIDRCIKHQNDEALTLEHLAQKLSYSEFYISRKFKEISGMQFRDYLRYRRLAFALKQVRDTQSSFLEIGLNHGFSSHEAFTRAFKETYGMSPREYRQNPTPVHLQSIIRPFDCYLLEAGGTGMLGSVEDIKTYFVRIPAHKFLHIKNYESRGYWDFWQKQSLIPGQDCETICGILDSIKGKLDDNGGSEMNSGSGQIMAYINEPTGRICSWGIPLSECYGVRLPIDYDGEIPPQMHMVVVPEAEYIVFEHGPFDFETENSSVEQLIEEAMKTFDYSATGYCLDTSPNRIFYFYHDCLRFWKYIRPVRKV
ncbi:AraC family transcriptional regulator [Erysipelothrix larvae]|uniref:AraC family transcriptional regulator n=1 Tax=Erysipelothrix larvae TaxID=1514105 RepID=A0A0X8H073_9FIRM|nr:helix-turn-helix transcriptional regulator [Erysipelothrix larvae]AMC93657.1 AraC family transcriptional regulator [Erysipelothrix larvae]